VTRSRPSAPFWRRCSGAELALLREPACCQITTIGKAGSANLRTLHLWGHTDEKIQVWFNRTRFACSRLRAGPKSLYHEWQRQHCVSVIDTTTNTAIGSPITVGPFPLGVAVTPDGSTVYVTNHHSNTVSTIDTVTDTVSGTPISVGLSPFGVTVTPDGSTVYVTHETFLSGTVSAIDTATNTVSATIPVGSLPFGVAVTPDGGKVYLTHKAATRYR
jgi:YVTN family beta-propeller protein